MSLLTESFEAFIVINKTTVSDGRGGTRTTYTEGTEIMGAMPNDGSTPTKIAEAMGVKALYTLTVRKNVDLEFHTILKRKRDNKYFRLTTGTDDHQTPGSAGLNMRQYSAEEFKFGGANGQVSSNT